MELGNGQGTVDYGGFWDVANEDRVTYKMRTKEEVLPFDEGRSTMGEERSEVKRLREKGGEEEVPSVKNPGTKDREALKSEGTKKGEAIACDAILILRTNDKNSPPQRVFDPVSCEMINTQYLRERGPTPLSEKDVVGEEDINKSSHTSRGGEQGACLWLNHRNSKGSRRRAVAEIHGIGLEELKGGNGGSQWRTCSLQVKGG